MIPYYNPHYGISDLAKTFFCSDSESKLVKHFQAISGKRYILITSSCRSALYLAYKAIRKTGRVHTSPLTCKVALMPILASGNNICFHDVKASDWTINPETIAAKISDDSVAIQAIHLGGFSCDMPSLKRIAIDHDLVLIEDCAQGYGAQYDGTAVGTLGDISCFTLTKNLFGLGGGILATDVEEWYHAAKMEQISFPTEKLSKLAYRVLITMLATHRRYLLCEKMYQFIKELNAGNNETGDHSVLLKELKKPTTLYAKSVSSRLSKIDALIKRRIQNAKSILDALDLRQDMKQMEALVSPSYVKLFLLTTTHSKQTIKGLNRDSVEAMHLEHKHRVYYQERLLKYSEEDFSEGSLVNYSKIHDRLISLPLLEIDADNRLIAKLNSVVRSLD